MLLIPTTVIFQLLSVAIILFEALSDDPNVPEVVHISPLLVLLSFAMRALLGTERVHQFKGEKIIIRTDNTEMGVESLPP